MNNRSSSSGISEKEQFKVTCQKLSEHAIRSKLSIRKLLIKKFGSMVAWEKKCADFELNLVIHENTAARLIFSLTDPKDLNFGLGMLSPKNMKFIMVNPTKKRKYSKSNIAEEWLTRDSAQMMSNKKRRTDNVLNHPLERQERAQQKKWKFIIEDGMQSGLDSDSDDSESTASDELQKNIDSLTLNRVTNSDTMEQEKQVFMRDALKNAQVSDGHLKIVYVTPSGKIIVPDVNSCENQWAEYQAEFAMVRPSKEKDGVIDVDALSQASDWIGSSTSTTSSASTTSITVSTTFSSETTVATVTHPVVEDQQPMQEVGSQNIQNNIALPDQMDEQQDTMLLDFSMTDQNIFSNFNNDDDGLFDFTFLTEHDTSSVPAVQTDTNVSGNLSTLFCNVQQANQQSPEKNNRYSADDEWFSPCSPNPFD